MTTQDTTLDQAAQTYIRRRDRLEHPDGKFDNKRRWYPSDAEWRPCCDKIRSPSAAFPYSLMAHCRTVEHVAALTGVDTKAIRREVRRLEPPKPVERPSGNEFFKAVAVTEDGRFISIFDGETEYAIGEKRTQAVRKGHGGGYYVYETAATARRAVVPADSVAAHLPRALLRVRAEGQHTTYRGTCPRCLDDTWGEDWFPAIPPGMDGYHWPESHPTKHCFSSITPIDVVEMPRAVEAVA